MSVTCEYQIGNVEDVTSSLQ